LEKQGSWREAAARCRKDLERFKPANERIKVFIGFEVVSALWRHSSGVRVKSPGEVLEIARSEDRMAQRMIEDKIKMRQWEASHESLLSTRERQMNFGQHLQELGEEDRFFVLPMMIKSVRIENIGPIKEFSADFSEGVNIVYGPNGCGKTVLVRTLYDFFRGRCRLRYRLTHGKDEGWVSATPYWPQTRFRYTESGSTGEALTCDAKRCALLDEPVIAITKEETAKFLAFLMKRFAQVILTTKRKDRWSLDQAKLVEMNIRR